jgi:glycosyltransferase involved in cell wall biosynthesis
MSESITFILCGSGKKPVGGFRIIYEYANRLSKNGWKVYIIHPATYPTVPLPLIKRIKKYVYYLYCLISKSFLPSSWFPIDPKVRMLWVPDLQEKNIPDADYIVAGPVESAFFVNSYSGIKGKKIYLIQGFEDWSMKKEDVERSWKFPMKKIVVSQWLKTLINNVGQEAICIPNGLDLSFFKIQNHFDNRPFFSIIFLYHELSLKGCLYTLEALAHLKKKYPTIAITTFSIYPKPAGFPEFIHYYYNPSQEMIRTLYNSSAIYISSSLSDGWDLPLCEAILCGCVCVATDIPVHREYMAEGVNGFFCTPGSVEAIIDKVEYIFSHQEFALKISENAWQTLKKFNWDSRVKLFEQALLLS